MANTPAMTTSTHSLTAYNAVPECSVSAISSGLSCLFSTTTTRALSCESPTPSSPEWETSAAKQQHEARMLDSVHCELDEYLEEPLETFSQIERAGGVERTVIFDILAYWEVRPIPFHLLHPSLTPVQVMEDKFPNLFCLAMDILPAQASSVPCKHLFLFGKETHTPHRNRIQPRLMEALQALKFSSHNNPFNLTEHLSTGFYPIDGGDLEVCDVLETACSTESTIFV